MDSAGSEKPQSFGDRWSAATKHGLASSTHNALPDPSHAVLTALRARRGSETAKWLNTLKSDIAPESQSLPTNEQGTPITSLQAPPIPSAYVGTMAENAMIDRAIKAVDRVFVEFELYAVQFNRTAQGTDFLVSCTRPIKNNDADGNCSSYAGHLSTRHWALVMRGCSSKVEAYVIPAELLLAFSIHAMNEAGYEPLLVVEADWHDGEPTWHIEKQVITLEQVPALARELFGDLIRIATGTMSEAELFAHTKQEFSIGTNLAVGYQTPAPGAPTNAQAVISPDLNTSAPNAVPANSALPKTAPAASMAPVNAAPARASLSGMPAAISPDSQSGISLSSLLAADQLLVMVNQDINQLLEVGKIALQSDNPKDFEKIKILTAKMDALKTSISNSLDDVRKAAE